jgi:tellurite resistance protein
MQVMHYPVGTLCRPGAVEMFVGTTYWVAYQDPVIAARVRVALASRFTVDEALSSREAKINADFQRMTAEVENVVGSERIEAAKQRWLSRGRQRMLIVSQLAQEIRDGKL